MTTRLALLPLTGAGETHCEKCRHLDDIFRPPQPDCRLTNYGLAIVDGCYKRDDECLSFERAASDQAEELAAIRARVAEDAATIERLNDEITRLRSRLAALEAKRTADISALDQHWLEKFTAETQRCSSLHERLAALEAPPVVPLPEWDYDPRGQWMRASWGCIRVLCENLGEKSRVRVSSAPTWAVLADFTVSLPPGATDLREETQEMAFAVGFSRWRWLRNAGLIDQTGVETTPHAADPDAPPSKPWDPRNTPHGVCWHCQCVIEDPGPSYCTDCMPFDDCMDPDCKEPGCLGIAPRMDAADEGVEK